MALVKTTFAPGIDKQTTTYGAEGRWVDSKNVRFRTGLPEKVGGWSKVVPTKKIAGVARASIAWVSLTGVRHLALGTDRKLYIYTEGQFYDVTPIRLEAALTGPFAMTNGSPTVTVTHSSHGASIGDFVTFDSFSTAQGLDMNNEFEVTTVIDGNSYTVTHTSNATGTASSQGGSGNAKYQINVGTDRSAFGFGWGTGAWNQPRQSIGGGAGWNRPGLTTTIALEATYWMFDTFGEDLLAIRNDDALYRWDLSGGTGTRAVKVSQAPGKNRVLLVSSPDRHIFLMGTETTIGTPGSQDDLYLRFSSQENFTAWAPASTNTAGSFRIQDGSKIVAAKRSRGSILVWTDTALHALNNIGPPFIFGLNQIGSNCGAISANSVADVNGVTYWMSQTAFYTFDGAIKKLNCTVQDFVFDDINSTAQGQVSIAVNTDFNEVTWFYASESSNFLDRSVTYNYLEDVWYTNDGFVRTSWVDRGTYAKPYATFYDPNSIPNNNTILGVTAGCTTLYEHEDGFNDDGQAMDCQITSGDFDIKEGDEVFLCSRVIPDFKDQAGNTDVKIEFANYPASTNTRSFTSTTSSTTKFFSVRGRGRQANVKISSNTIDSNWRFGTVRLDINPDGRR
tara:strand:- start:439 stop:2298 length:1860 start_codon:yes stop_codon:yes gene_type:complete